MDHIAFLRTFLVLMLVTLSAQDLQSNVKTVTSLSNALVPKLFQALSPGRENVVFSPFGVASSLAMLLEGATGNTATELQTALGVAADERQAVRDGFKAYFDTFEHSAESLSEEAAGAFSMALMRTAGSFSNSYKALLAQFYRVNISDAKTPTTNTGPEAVELRVDAGVLSHWKDFDRLGVFTYLSQQAAAPFQRSGRVDDVIDVPMIPQVGMFRAGKVASLGCQALELPLEVGTFSLMLLVPDGPDHMDEVLVKLPETSFQQLTHWLSYAETEVALPQFTALSSGLDLTPVIRQLGVRALFNASASGLGLAAAPGTAPLYVKAITQDAFFSASFVAVNSVGAVSSHISGAKRPKRESSDRFLVNRPFLFFLMHRDTQLVLLAGKVQNPTQVP